MSVTIEAIYENGALHPLEPLPINEGEKVSFTLEDEPAKPINGGFVSGTPLDAQSLFERIQEIAAQSTRYGRVETGSVDHDHYLYGAPKQSERQNDDE